MLKNCALKSGPVDFVLYIADDPYNEKVYSYLNSLKKQKNNAYLAENNKIFACTIGRRVT